MKKDRFQVAGAAVKDRRNYHWPFISVRQRSLLFSSSKGAVRGSHPPSKTRSILAVSK
jgi:hypothetical protein